MQLFFKDRFHEKAEFNYPLEIQDMRRLFYGPCVYFQSNHMKRMELFLGSTAVIDPLT